ncbi:hypothetical protein LXA43DRAFT_321537 [Ganoderma leucocontextum]|nr:hypothetical protein LXA43DRAFT_321537 [Ganoderma leucocontextum]
MLMVFYDTPRTVVRGRLVRPMYIYKERDIERRAWERHGGPEAFDKYLAKWRESYLKKNGPRAHFTQPRTYEDPHGEVSIVSIKPGISRLGPVDPYVGRSPTLLNIKNQMAPWLWTAYNKALSAIDDLNWEASAFGGPGFFMRDKDREGPMKDALVLAPTYPPRPTEPLPSSASMDKVRAVLAEAANLPEGGPGWGRDDVPGLTFVSGYGGAGEPFDYYEWSGDYFESLFAALIEVIDAHGLGPEGLEGIRWEVYDKYVKCMHAGPHYDRGEEVWTDKAAEWLDGQFASVGNTCRKKCAAGRRYNDILPRRHRRGHPSVGVHPH